MIEAYSITQALGDALFRDIRVFLLSEPETPLRVKRINWNRQSSDLQDSQGRIYRDVSWDDIEFADGEEYRVST